MLNFVGIAGQYRTGKNSVTEHLVSKLNSVKALGKWEEGSFAKPVKQIFCEAFGVDLDFIEKWKVTNDIPDGFEAPIRDGLTLIGNGFRTFKSNIWIDKFFKNAKSNNVICDARYVNEFKEIRERGGIVVLLFRPGFENSKQSRSEQEVVPFVNKLRTYKTGPVCSPELPIDFWLVNDGSLEELHDKIDNILLPFILEKFLD